ncbi:hypothetical protein [Myxococcus stipitatus]|uniref:hypothetical protein n=1 Tax=Myxococcus stipitatus TaxID=83455 RepID=UPI0030CA686D
MAHRSPVLLVACGAVLVAVACSINMDEVAGRACADDTECPSLYACTATGVSGQRTCEVVYPPHYTGADGGGTDAGPVPTYCNEVQPILAATCVSNCHGADTSGSQQSSFRLDYYEPTTGNGVPGARAKALRIRVRASDMKDMPPAGSPAPTAEQRALLARWVAGGAPQCSPDGGP